MSIIMFLYIVTLELNLCVIVTIFSIALTLFIDPSEYFLFV